MADGTFAILMLVAGLADMGLNYCGTETGCVGRTETAPRVAISGGQVLERRAETGGEAYLRYDLGHRIGPFGQAVGLSIGDKGEAWVGFGQTYRQSFGSTPFYAELHAMTGLYRAGDGLDLGGPIVFRSGIEAGWENRRDGGSVSASTIGRTRGFTTRTPVSRRCTCGCPFRRGSIEIIISVQSCDGVPFV